MEKGIFDTYCFLWYSAIPVYIQLYFPYFSTFLSLSWGTAEFSRCFSNEPLLDYLHIPTWFVPASPVREAANSVLLRWERSVCTAKNTFVSHIGIAYI